ncbi:hypothetical protein HMI54_002450 [Coelomomyces lativittatus]|nr:hypothetical protein HMI55_002628 [Coelomomyces lativittatus]KAJ1509331.1 hypothetical protein HMI54_002450 [Coelomomyces lativittatus]
MDFSTPIYFTPSQIHAIRSGISHGLTLIVGPPGTGKTDVAVHLLCNLYHGQPNERILLLTHSNQALNQLFEKLLVLNNIPERHLLRLGHSDEEWTGYDQYGRVTHFMERRADLLQKVDVLAKSLNIVGDHAYTCETATAFFKSIIQPLWSTFKKEPFASDNESWKAFPFHSFFRTLYPNNSLLQADIPPNEQIDSIFDACWHYLVSLFDDISQSRAFEVLKSDWDKANLLLARDAKIVAMTTTYASLKRNDLIDLGFEFDSFVMEEAGTVLEIETFVPLSLSRRLKRVVMIGDHRQLPPVVQCPSLQAMADSLFVRLIRLGVTTISLDQQGRTRKSICELYHHVYPGLGHLPVVETMVDANPGFLLEYQFINVLNYRGQGEIQPEPHYYQNLGEAEYMVAVYQYMCLLGYPKDQVVMLTTYNGQKILLKEVLRKRCSWNLTLFPPCLITTVDKFQGQQANYVLLSLVRTEKVGHVADLRRLVVAMSRARLGLYIFGRQTLFEVWPDLAPTFHHLLSRPTQLQLLPNECFPCQRKLVEHQESANAMTIRDVDAMCRLVMHITKQRKLDMNENSNNIDKNEKLGEERVE